jgi:uncharacterized membrane protein YbhN (UPF0104 family)
MSKKFWVVFQSVFFALIGAILLYLSFRKTDFASIATILKSGNYWVMAPVFMVSLMVYLSRIKRWQLLYESIGTKAPLNYLFASLATGYLVNFAVPRLGEISRALILKRWLNYPVNTSLSTIVFERITDVLCLVIILIMAFTLEFVYQGSILHHFTGGVQLFTWGKFGILLVLLIVIWVLYSWLKNKKDGFSEWLNQFIQTTFTLLHMKKKAWFLFHTLVIWIGFYFMTYTWFFMFEESKDLGFYKAFLVLVLGLVPRSLPIQAGSAGAYHFVVSQALFLLGVSLTVGNALAIVIHGFQTIITLLFGGAAYLWLLLQKNASNDSTPESLTNTPQL